LRLQIKDSLKHNILLDISVRLEQEL